MRVRATWQGAVLARSNRALVVGGRTFFPPDSVDPTWLRPSDVRAQSWQGEAVHRTVEVDGHRLEAGCWSYPSPTAEASRLADYVTFGDEVEILVETDARAPEGLVEALAQLDPALWIDVLPPALVTELAFFGAESSATPSFFADADATVRRVNRAFAWAFGAEARPVGRSLEELLSTLGVEPETSSDALEALAARGVARVDEIRVVEPARIRYFSLELSSTGRSAGPLAGVYGRLEDITERVELRDEARAANFALEHYKANLQLLLDERTEEADRALEHLTAIIDNISDGILVTDTSRSVRLVNPALRALFDLPPYVLSQPADESFPADLVELVRAIEEPGAAAAMAEVELPNARIAKAVANPMTSSAGEPLGAVTVVRDITFEKEVDRMKTDFIANVSHELRTPLTSILGFANIISRRLEMLLPLVDRSSPKVERYVDQVGHNLGIVISEGERLTRIINDVLDIAKMESGKMEWRSEPTSINEVVRRAAAASSGLFSEGPVSLELELEPDLPSLTADPERLVQVVINLISNAAKFTRVGRVTCATSRTDAGVEVAVRDTGIGIPEEELEAVFEKFRQVGNTLTDKPLGTGLGLPLCRHVVEHHRGRIWARSALGEGSTFSFVLPASGAPGEDLERTEVARALVRQLDGMFDPHGGAAPESLLEARGSAVLVVDDDPSIRRMVRQELEALGHAVTEAGHGLEAVRLAKASPPDLVVLDVMMPQMSGYDVAAVLKSDPRTRDVPLIVYSVADDRDRGLRVGVDLYLQKSSDTAELVRAVQRTLDRGGSRKRVLVIDEDESTVRSLSRLLSERGYRVAASAGDATLAAAAKDFQPDIVVVDAERSEAREALRSLHFRGELGEVVVLVLGPDGAASTTPEAVE